MNPILPRVQTAMHHALRHRFAVAILLPSLLAITPTTAQAAATTPQNAPRTAMTDNGKRLLRGTVTDENGEPLMGVSVSADGSTPFTVTDADGKFSVPMPANTTQLTFTYVGMATQTINIGQRSNFHITMSAGEQALKDVVVTGYQTISRERTTGSFNVVTPEKLKGKLQTSILARLEGMVPGMMQQNGTLYIRGMSTLNGGANAYSPLFVVDGLPFEGDINSINPATIKSITVLKDAAAASIYGARAANGVVVISTIDAKGENKATIRYDASVKFTPKPDMDYLNLMDTREMMDLREYGFKFNSIPYAMIPPNYYLDPVSELLYKHRDGLIDEQTFQDGMNKYRNLNNRKQLEDFYTQTGIEHQHNLSLSGGNDINRYVFTLNYLGNRFNARYNQLQRYGATLRDNIKLTSWLNAEAALTINYNSTQSDRGMGTYADMYRNQPSYTMLKDENGNPLNVPTYKSEWEMKRLTELGLKDEHYSPITNRREERYDSKENYYRLMLGLNLKIMKGLNFDVRFQTENSADKTVEIHSERSYYVRNMINDAAQYNPATKKLTLNVPEGAQYSESRGDADSYTLRAQLNFNRDFGPHSITALAGGERRRTKTTNTSIYYMGFNESTLAYKPIDPTALTNVKGTESLAGNFSWSFTGNNWINEIENRYVSFYANAAYAFDSKYNLTASIRVDQSNLFGTDPRYQYRPLWSVGGAWHIAKERFLAGRLSWLNALTLRATYGIGGNVPRGASPYVTLKAAQYNPWSKDFMAEIKSPPNYTLRWEKTATTNLGLDFSVLNNRLSGSIEVYRKHSTDLLAQRDADPTLGFKQLTLNYGNMTNKGIEVSLNSVNLQTRNLRWTTGLNFGYNKNMLDDVEDSNPNVHSYTSGFAAVKGHPLGAIFSFQYAGLSPTDGTPRYYVEGGSKTEAQVSNLSDLVYSGTRHPTYSWSFSNTIAYKDFELSFMLMFYGGNVLRTEPAPFVSEPSHLNPNKEMRNIWRQPGDERNPDATPAFTGYALDLATVRHPWYAADRHVFKADYAKLRHLSLTYRVPQRLVSKCGLAQLAFTLQGQNLLSWTANKYGVDPEALGTTGYGWGMRTIPTPATWTFGLSATF
ncbi:MAG: SusC/RagA family TonB-linked outer membrane protein [Prevotella sp.]